MLSKKPTPEFCAKTISRAAFVEVYMRITPEHLQASHAELITAEFCSHRRVWGFAVQYGLDPFYFTEEAYVARTELGLSDSDFAKLYNLYLQ